jgi:hypothetical protein
MKGRKVPKGTFGKVFWIGNNGYGSTVGIALTNKKEKKYRNGRLYETYIDIAFVNLSYVEVVGAESDEAISHAITAWENQMAI